MRKRFISFILTIAVCVMVGSIPIVADETNDEFVSQNKLVMEPKSEYQMAVEETQRLEAIAQVDDDEANTGSMNASPIEEFKVAFDARAKMDSETLSGMGYTAEEIKILHAYTNGQCTFEQAATRASAILTPELTCPKHDSDKYSIRYFWKWDKTPVGLGEDGFALGVHGIDSNSQGFVTKLNYSRASVTYNYTDGTFYKTENPLQNVTANTVTTKFDSYKLNDLGDRWVWAQSGYIVMDVSPAVSGSKTFAALRAAGEYGHASGSTVKMDVSVSVDILTGNITPTFSTTSSKGHITPYGKKQSIFYNNGTEHVEA